MIARDNNVGLTCHCTFHKFVIIRVSFHNVQCAFDFDQLSEAAYIIDHSMNVILREAERMAQLFA